MIDIQLIKKAIPIKQILNQHAKPDSSGLYKCIFHNDKTASMKVYDSTNKVYCFGCGRSADVIDVYAELNNCNTKQAITELAELAGICNQKIDKETRERIRKVKEAEILRKQHESEVDYTARSIVWYTNMINDIKLNDRTRFCFIGKRKEMAMYLCELFGIKTLEEKKRLINEIKGIL